MKTIEKLLALAALLSAPLLAQPSGNTLPRNNPTFIGTLTGPLEVLNQPGIATTSTDALMLQNVTAATVGVPVQYSPRLHFVGHAWNLTATAADNYLDVIEELRPASASVPSAALTWSFRRSTAGTGSFVDFGSMEPNSTTGGLLFKALGTNQSITLTPSGTGTVNVAAGDITLVSGANYGWGTGGAETLLISGNLSTNVMGFRTNGTTNVRIASTGNLLLGGLTVDDGANTLQTNGSISLGAGKIAKYNSISTVGNGVETVLAAGRVTAQNAAVASVSAYTVGASDASFRISANVNVTTATLHNFTMTCVYTDEGNTSRTLTLGFTQLTGSTLLTAITNATGAGPYESLTYQIRCKASTTITFATTGTFTTVTYNAEGVATQVN